MSRQRAIDATPSPRRGGSCLQTALLCIWPRVCVRCTAVHNHGRGRMNRPGLRASIEPRTPPTAPLGPLARPQPGPRRTTPATSSRPGWRSTAGRAGRRPAGRVRRLPHRATVRPALLGRKVDPQFLDEAIDLAVAERPDLVVRHRRLHPHGLPPRPRAAAARRPAVGPASASSPCSATTTTRSATPWACADTAHLHRAVADALAAEGMRVLRNETVHSERGGGESLHLDRRGRPVEPDVRPGHGLRRRRPEPAAGRAGPQPADGRASRRPPLRPDARPATRTAARSTCRGSAG